jgi:ABC-type polysaccharide/polyol phosphate export permease
VLDRPPKTYQSMTLQYQTGHSAALEDLKQSIQSPAAWWVISKQQVLSKYRRTILGPWWITLQRLFFISGLSLLFGTLLGREIADFIPYVAIGFIVFSVLVSSLNTSATLITANISVLKNSAMPVSILNFRFISTTLIQLGHDLVAVAITLLVLHRDWSEAAFSSVLGLALVLINAFAISFWVAPLAARFRDLAPLIQTLSSVFMFITPIFWYPDDLAASQRNLLTAWNPFAYLLEIVRSPILGDAVSPLSWISAISFTLFNLALGFYAFSFSRQRLRYWV